ncbi:hypothetical protein ACFL3X_01785, partial [Gemmatimonadota bacterium]
TIASEGKGIIELAAAIDTQQHWLTTSGEGERRRRSRIVAYVKEIVQEALAEGLWEEGAYRARLEESLEEIMAGRKDPFSVAEEILAASGMLATLNSDKA